LAFLGDRSEVDSHSFESFYRETVEANR
jgi:hypothetical protein